jgi:Ca2+-binding EF-hand superfamily protein
MGLSRLRAEAPRAAGEGAVEVRSTGGTVFVDAGDVKLDVHTYNGPILRDAGLPSFRSLDKDQNDYLDATELKAVIPANAFALLDTDQDGKVSREEYAAFVRRRNKLLTATIVLHVTDLGQEVFDSLDLDKDGRLTRLELQQAPRLLETLGKSERRIGGRSFPRMLDWELTRGDMSNRGAAGGMRSTPPLPPQKADSQAPDWFRRMDLNSDGVLERHEFLGKPADFDRLDANHDGLLTPAEAAAYQVRPSPAVGLSRKS